MIDFGIAKATNQRLTDSTLATAHAQMLGTPLYMSPEQAELSPLEIDTRSDIYSLGVLLYELLTGSTPVEKEQFESAPLDEIRRLIREKEPPRPSVRISTLDVQAISTLAEDRRSSPKRLRQLVRGDLDWIVMRAIEKDRTRRYETASALAADVRRYLADEPVVARPPSTAYRVRKFARRNRRAVLAAVLLLAILIGGTVGTTWQATRATQAGRRARAAQQKAHQAINEYFTLVSEEQLLHEPSLQPLRSELLKSARNYYREFVRAERNNPELQAELAVTCFRITILTYESGSKEDWVPWFAEGVDAVDGLLRDGQDLSAYSGLSAGQRWIGAGITLPVRDYDDTLRALQKAASVWEELVRRYPAVPGFQNELAAFYLGLGALYDHFVIGGLHEDSRQEQAGAYYAKAVELYRTLAGADPGESKFRAGLAMGSGCSGALAMRRRRIDEAEAAIRQALRAAGELVAEFPGVPGWRGLLGLRHQELGLVLEHLRRLGGDGVPGNAGPIR